jgi:hypothetical protein
VTLPTGPSLSTWKAAWLTRLDAPPILYRSATLPIGRDGFPSSSGHWRPISTTTLAASLGSSDAGGALGDNDPATWPNQSNDAGEEDTVIRWLTASTAC